MTMSSAKQIGQIVSIMEMVLQTGSIAPNSFVPDQNVGGVMAGMMGNDQNQDEYPDFTDEEMKLAKRFIEIVGCPERAEELLAKAIEGLEYLGLVDDEVADSVTIDAVAQAMPLDVGAPSTVAHMVSSFDPSN
jgi:hypothetical protein